MESWGSGSILGVRQAGCRVPRPSVPLPPQPWGEGSHQQGLPQRAPTITEPAEPWELGVLSCPQVALRIRPLSDVELQDGATIIAHKLGDQVRLRGAQDVTTATTECTWLSRLGQADFMAEPHGA